MLTDPSIGPSDTSIGSVAWAKLMRVRSQTFIREAVNAPQPAKHFVATFVKYRVWTLLDTEQGGRFATFKEFCEAPRPHGWGLDLAELLRVTEFALTCDGVNGKRALAVGTVAPARPRRLKGPAPKRGHGGPRVGSSDVPPNIAPPRAADDKRAERLRAIAERAPAAARDLFRRDLLGLVEAAALGKPQALPGTWAYDPIAHERVHAATKAAVAVVAAAAAPKTPVETRRLQRTVNAAVREKLAGAKAARARPNDAVTVIVDMVRQAVRCFNDEQRAHLRDVLVVLLGS